MAPILAPFPHVQVKRSFKELIQAYVPIAIIMVMASAIRFYNLSEESLGQDEGYSLRDAGSIEGQNLSRPLYYLLLRGWMQFGDGEAWLRLPSVLFGIGCIAILYPIARRLADTRVALLACALLAISVSPVNQSQAVRMYTMASFLLLCTLYFLMRWVDTRSARDLLGHACFAGLALATSQTTLMGWLLAVALAAYVVWRDRRAAFTLIGVTALLLIAWSPLAILSKQTAAAYMVYDREIPSLLHLLVTPAKLLTHKMGVWNPGLANHLMLGIFLLVYGCLHLAAVLYRRQEPAARNCLLVAFWFSGTVLLTFIQAVTNVPFWGPRYFIPIAPGLLILLGIGLVSLLRFQRSLAMMAGVVLFGGVMFCLVDYYRVMDRQDVRGVARWIQAYAAPKDLVCLLNPDQSVLWRYYYRGAAPVHADVPEISAGKAVDDRAIATFLRQLPPHRGRTWFAILAPQPKLNRAGFYPALHNYLDRFYPKHGIYRSAYVEALWVDLQPAKSER